MNKYMNHRDMGLIKGALRRAFSRSDLYKEVYEKYRVEHSDPNHPKCKNWVYCAACGLVIQRWKTALDHIDPVIPIDKHFEDMPLLESVDRMWCDPSNLQVLCDTCHDKKTAAEREARKPYKKPSKPRKRKAKK